MWLIIAGIIVIGLAFYQLDKHWDDVDIDLGGGTVWDDEEDKNE